MEEWRDIPGWEGMYQVSNQGRVRSVDRTVWNVNSYHRIPGVVLRPAVAGKTGHLGVSLCRNGKPKTYRIHQLMMWAFVGSQEPGMDVCHYDGDPTNNILSNLRYDTRSGNRADKVRHGRDHQLIKTHCPRGHLLNGRNVTESGLRQNRRDCRSCGNARAYMKHHNISMSELQKYSDSYYAKYTKESI